MHAYVAGIHVFLRCISPSKTWMAGIIPAMTLRSCASPPSCAGLSRASTSLQHCNKQAVDGRNKSGHDASRQSGHDASRQSGHDAACLVPDLSIVMRGLDPRIHVFLRGISASKTWMAGMNPAMTLRVSPAMTLRVNPASTAWKYLCTLPRRS